VKRPTPGEIHAASQRTVSDVIAPGLNVLFCGINPGLYTAATGYHFARPGNRFWPALHLAGITPRLFAPSEQSQLLELGYGITNVVARASAGADELTRAELVAGGQVLEEKVRRYAPRFLAVLGVGAYRSAFNRPRAVMGPQPEPLGGAQVWILPNPSGLNAHYSLARLAEQYRELKLAAEET
jgi:TDG/mug DNA glycosylase family protein